MRLGLAEPDVQWTRRGTARLQVRQAECRLCACRQKRDMRVKSADEVCTLRARRGESERSGHGTSERHGPSETVRARAYIREGGRGVFECGIVLALPG
jgi:hypothetical protein